jgi:hypothetical protein
MSNLSKHRQKILEKPEELEDYGYFYYQYKPNYFYFDFLVYLKRLAFLLANIMLVYALIQRSILIINALYFNLFLCILTYIQFIMLEPYKKHLISIQSLERFSALTLIFTWVCCITWYSQDDQGSLVLGLFLFSVSLIMNVFLGAAIFIGIFSNKAKILRNTRIPNFLRSFIDSIYNLKKTKLVESVLKFSKQHSPKREENINHFKKENKKLKCLIILMSKQIKKWK